MASEFCLSLTKYFLFLFNLVFFLLGSLLLSLGLWVKFTGASIFIPSPYMSTSLFSYLLIISGSVTIGLGFIGCLGSLKTVRCLLAIYFILLTVLLAAQIVGGVLFYTQKAEMLGSLGVHTLKLIESFGRNESNLQDFKDNLQVEKKCCGWMGKGDWGTVIPCSCFDTGNATVNSTYSEPSQLCHPCLPEVSISNHTCRIYKQGCKNHITKWLDENLLLILGVILAISLVEICGMFLSMSLYKQDSVDYNIVLK
ncbi:hypothetical protein PO909_012660 [Leuciscus waleckii]